jgi:hypothetical protein
VERGTKPTAMLAGLLMLAAGAQRNREDPEADAKAQAESDHWNEVARHKRAGFKSQRRHSTGSE